MAKKDGHVHARDSLHHKLLVARAQQISEALITVRDLLDETPAEELLKEFQEMQNIITCPGCQLGLRVHEEVLRLCLTLRDDLKGIEKLSQEVAEQGLRM